MAVTIQDMHDNVVVYIENQGTGNLHDNNSNGTLLFAVTEVELKSLFSELEKIGKKIVSKRCGNLFYSQAEGFSEPVFICQSEMGSMGPSSVMNILTNAIEKLRPCYVIMCGIAFGLKKNISIGDVVVSKQVWSYEPGKITEGKMMFRGDKTTASNFLLQCFTAASVQYDKMRLRSYKILKGTYASGEKLVDDADFKNSLLLQEPELSAGDMESAGLSSVCISRGVNWIIVKGISDLGYQKKDEYQEIAARNAAAFVIFTLDKILYA